MELNGHRWESIKRGANSKKYLLIRYFRLQFLITISTISASPTVVGWLDGLLVSDPSKLTIFPSFPDSKRTSNVLKLVSVRIVIEYLLFIQTQVTCLHCPSRCCIYLIHTAFLFNVLHWIASGFSTSDGRWWLAYCTNYIVHPLTSGLPSKLRGISESKGSINGYVCY